MLRLNKSYTVYSSITKFTFILFLNLKNNTSKDPLKHFNFPYPYGKLSFHCPSYKISLFKERWPFP